MGGEIAANCAKDGSQFFFLITSKGWSKSRPSKFHQIAGVNNTIVPRGTRQVPGNNFVVLNFHLSRFFSDYEFSRARDLKPVLLLLRLNQLRLLSIIFS